MPITASLLADHMRLCDTPPITVIFCIRTFILHTANKMFREDLSIHSGNRNFLSSFAKVVDSIRRECFLSLLFIVLHTPSLNRRIKADEFALKEIFGKEWTRTLQP
jgi:hypothetical protein